MKVHKWPGKVIFYSGSLRKHYLSPSKFGVSSSLDKNNLQKLPSQKEKEMSGESVKPGEEDPKPCKHGHQDGFINVGDCYRCLGVKLCDVIAELEVTKQLAEQRGHSLMDATEKIKWLETQLDKWTAEHDPAIMKMGDRIEKLEALCKELVTSSVKVDGILRDIITGDPITPKTFSDVAIASNDFCKAIAKYTALLGGEGK